jgi:hypothetical protein
MPNRQGRYTGMADTLQNVSNDAGRALNLIQGQRDTEAKEMENLRKEKVEQERYDDISALLKNIGK